jgi:NADP-dependent 3-hydroxy acid dehydrogenase YdfG
LVERGSVQAVGVAGLDRQYHVNVRAPYALTTALLPALGVGKGTIVFVNSTQGLAAGADAVGYAATKHALKAFADGLRAELSGGGVRVCSIYPGRTDTRGQREIFAYEGREYTPAALVKPETVADFILAAVNLPSEAELVDVTVRPSRRA